LALVFKPCIKPRIDARRSCYDSFKTVECRQTRASAPTTDLASQRMDYPKEVVRKALLKSILRWACQIILGFAIAGSFDHAAKADIGVVVADPTNIGASAYTHSGHSLVYLSGICAVTPVQARLCNAGEQGSIVTTYPPFGETENYAWNLVPLSLYLQGSLSTSDRLLYGSKPVKEALEVHAREGYFQDVCGEGVCPQAPHSYWRNLVDTTADRDVFIFAVNTTPAQDQIAVDWLNTRSNVNHYNPFTNNCAVFTSSLVNLIFPHSVHRDFPNDLGMMAPKAAARSFTHWALKRPGLGFHTMHFAQQPGDLPRSGLAQSGTETAFHMKKYLIAAALIGDHEVAGSFFVAYFLTGRFGLYKEYSRHSSSSIVEIEAEAKTTKEDGDDMEWHALRTDVEEKRAAVTGSPEDWAGYRERYATLRESAIVREFSTGYKGFFPPEFDGASATVDVEGRSWLTVEMDGSTRQVGIGSENVMASGSDPILAFRLMLGKVGAALRAKNHQRETIEEFREDWSLLEQTQHRLLFHRDQLARVTSTAP
jgi:hypothetical protein